MKHAWAAHVFVTILGLACVQAEARAQNGGPIAILLNDRTFVGLAPLIRRGRVLVALGPVNVTLAAQMPGASPSNPAQALFSSMRAALVFDAATRTVTVVTSRLYPVTEARFASGTVGSTRLAVTTQAWTTPNARRPAATATRPLRVAPRVGGGLVYIPLRAFAEAAGAYVAWDGAKRTVVLRTLPPSPQELAAEAAARARLDAIGTNARKSLDNAARNLS